MAVHFKTNVDEITRKVISLKTQFSRGRKKVEKGRRSGAGTIPEENIWFGYDMMAFSMEKNISLGSRSLLQVCNLFYDLFCMFTKCLKS